MTRVVKIKTDEIEDLGPLRRSLQPILVLAYYGCITVSNWMSENKIRKSVLIIRRIGISIVFMFMVIVFGYQAHQLVLEISKPNSSINSIMPNLIWISCYPIGIMAVVMSFIKRKELQTGLKEQCSATFVSEQINQPLPITT